MTAFFLENLPEGSLSERNDKSVEFKNMDDTNKENYWEQF